MAHTVRQEFRDTPTTQLRPHPKNPRKGDVAAIVGSIEANGFYGTIVAQEGTGYVLAGNHRLAAANEAGLHCVPVMWVDVDEATAERILAADNRTSDLGTYDDTLLAELLSGISNRDGLDGTGYTPTALDDLIKSLTPPNVEPSSAGDQGKLDEKDPIVCPECGHKFHPEKT